MQAGAIKQNASELDKGKWFALEHMRLFIVLALVVAILVTGYMVIDNSRIQREYNEMSLLCDDLAMQLSRQGSGDNKKLQAQLDEAIKENEALRAQLTQAAAINAKLKEEGSGAAAEDIAYFIAQYPDTPFTFTISEATPSP